MVILYGVGKLGQISLQTVSLAVLCIGCGGLIALFGRDWHIPHLSHRDNIAIVIITKLCDGFFALNHTWADKFGGFGWVLWVLVFKTLIKHKIWCVWVWVWCIVWLIRWWIVWCINHFFDVAGVIIADVGGMNGFGCVCTV